VHQQPTATRCITFTSSPCLLQVCCWWPVHTHIPSCCQCTGSSSAMRISGGASATNGHDDSTTFTSYPCLLPEAGLIGNEDFRAFCSHHIHTHTPACCQWPGSLSAMSMSGSASATNGREEHHIHLISLPAAGSSNEDLST